MAEPLVVGASAAADLLVGTELAVPVRMRLRGHELPAPAHFDAEVLSALGRLHRAGDLTAAQVTARLGDLADAPFERHLLDRLVVGAWAHSTTFASSTRCTCGSVSTSGRP